MLVSMHKGPILSPLLLVVVTEAAEFRIGLPWELLYVDDLIFTAIQNT